LTGHVRIVRSFITHRESQAVARKGVAPRARTICRARLLATSALVATALTIAGCRSQPAPTGAETSAAPARGGSIVVSVRTEPRSFNRLAASDTTTVFVATLTQAKLVRINQATQRPEPMLAESWTTSPDQRHVTLKLRHDAVFSDGHPFTADDAVFTFNAAYDERVGSSVGDSLLVGGKKLTVTAADPYTVDITFPQPFAPGVELLDNLPMLPRHKLEAALKDGTFAKTWGLSTPPSEIVCVGPFLLSQYVPGQRLVFDRNPRYYRKASDGTQLPYLDRITVEIIPDQNAELLRLESGQIDSMTSEIAPEAYASLKRAAEAGRVKLLDLGIGYNANAFWFNLKPGAFTGDARAAWLQRDELRRAISMAVDRQRYADTVFLGAGVPVYGPETPANKQWYWAEQPKTPYDPSAAKALLASIGLVDKNGDGVLEDGNNQPAHFTLMTQKGRPELERGANVIRSDLEKIGLKVDVAALDASAVIQGIITAKYESVFFNPDRSALDPAVSPDFWFSYGAAHVWNMGQKTPATTWERDIDELMSRQMTAADPAERKRLYVEMQKIFSEHLPVIYFVAPRIYVAASSRLTNLTPAVWRPQLLWSPDTIAVTH
jgi:peptide/nickel transport system substrate-binding protein